MVVARTAYGQLRTWAPAGLDQLWVGHRVEGGTIYQRVFLGKDHARLTDPNAWSAWQGFLGQP
jgi:hypothetical protein